MTEKLHKILQIKTSYYLFAIFFLGALLRVTPVVYKEIKSPGWHERNINEIEFYYDDVARSLIAGKGFVHSVNPRPGVHYGFNPGTPFSYVPPLYAWYLYVVYEVFGPSIVAAKIVQSLMDAAVGLFLYVLARRIFHDRMTGVTAALLYAIYPLSIVMCSTLYYQIPMNLVLCLVMLSYMASTSLKTGALTGITLGIATLAKPVTLPLILILPVIKIVATLLKRESVHLAIRWSLLFLTFCLLTLAPWTIRNYQVFHEFVPIQKGADSPLLQGSKEEYIDEDVESLRTKYGNTFGLNPNQYKQVAITNHLKHYRDNTTDYMRFLGKKFLLSWYNTEGKTKNMKVLLLQLPFLTLAMLSLLYNNKMWLKFNNWYIPGVVLYICAVQVVFFPLARYTLVVMPMVMIMSANGLSLLANKFLKTAPHSL